MFRGSVEEAHDAYRWDGTWHFDDRVVLDRLEVSPSPLRVGQPVRVSLRQHSADGCRLELGLMPPRVQARQVVYPVDALPPDERSRWHTQQLDGETINAYFELPSPWHPAMAILVAQVHCNGRRLAATTGATAQWGPGSLGPDDTEGPPTANRTDAGRALLAALPVQRQPTEIHIPRGDASLFTGPVSDWPASHSVLVDSVDGEPEHDAARQTRVWFAWDDTGLHWAGQVMDRDLWAEHREHDDPLYEQEAMELFVGQTDEPRYLEYELSARNVRFDASFARYRRGDERWTSTWQTSTVLDGTLERSDDRDRGFQFVATIAWDELCEHVNVGCSPAPGTAFRLNVFRLERPDRKHTVAWALSPPLTPDFHDFRNAAEARLSN